MFGNEKRLELAGYIIGLLLDDEFRENHKQKFDEWVQQSDAFSERDFRKSVHRTVADMAHKLEATLYAHQLILKYKKEVK